MATDGHRSRDDRDDSPARAGGDVDDSPARDRDLARAVVDAVDDATVWVDATAVDPERVGLDVDVAVRAHEDEALETLGGVTEERADRLREAGYETVAALLRADADDVAAVDGVSSALASRITDAGEDDPLAELRTVAVTDDGETVAAFETWDDQHLYVDASGDEGAPEEWTVEREWVDADDDGVTAGLEGTTDADVYLGVSLGAFREAVPAEEVIVSEARYDDHGKVAIPGGDGTPRVVDEGIGSEGGDDPPDIGPGGDKIVTVRYADGMDVFDTRVDRPTADGIADVRPERGAERDDRGR